MALIAVSQNRRVTDYLESVRRAGGDPVELGGHPRGPAAIVARVRGVMLTGGGDVDPALYGEAPTRASNRRSPAATPSRSPWPGPRSKPICRCWPSAAACRC